MTEPTHCCEMMAYQLTQECDQHADPFDCPDHLVYRSADGGTFGLIVHDGGSSFIEIRYCPWCGTAVGVPEDDGSLVP